MRFERKQGFSADPFYGRARCSLLGFFQSVRSCRFRNEPNVGAEGSRLKGVGLRITECIKEVWPLLPNPCHVQNYDRSMLYPAQPGSEGCSPKDLRGSSRRHGQRRGLLGPRCRPIMQEGVGSVKRSGPIGPPYLTELTFWDSIDTPDVSLVSIKWRNRIRSNSSRLL